MRSLSNLANASRIASRIAYHHCIIVFVPCTWLIVSLLFVCLVWVEPGDEFATEEPVEFACEDPVNSDNCAGKIHTLEITTIFAMLVCSLFCYANAMMPTICFQASQIAMSNL